MENPSHLLNNQSSHQSTSSATEYRDTGTDTPQNSTIIVMLQQQQHLLQEVISTQQGMLKKQSDS